MGTIKNNLFYSLLLVGANYVLPFLTYPYVSRILGVEGIGACNFVDSVINYFILFSMLGLESLGVREIAKHKENKEELNRVFSNLLAVNLTLTSVLLILLVVVTFTVPQLSAHKDLMFFGGFKLVFNSLLIEWLYKGLEEFKWITMRSLSVKLIYVACVFIFVRQREDAWVYYMLSCSMVVVNALINIVFSKDKVRISFLSIEFSKTLKSMLSVGIYVILTSMYTTFNTMFLGFVAGETQVGYYSTATKLYGIVMAAFSAFTLVMIPRMSSFVSEGKMEEFKAYFGVAVDVLLGFSIPVIVWMMVMSPDIVRIISGPEFGGAVIPMMIVAPLLFVIGYEQILVLQTLLPMGRDRVLLRNSIIGAASGIALNVLLVPHMMAIGSASVWIICELVILVLSQFAVKQELSLAFPFKKTLLSLSGYIPLVLILLICQRLQGSITIRLLTSLFSVALYVFFYQLIVEKRNIVTMIFNR